MHTRSGLQCLATGLQAVLRPARLRMPSSGLHGLESVVRFVRARGAFDLSRGALNLRSRSWSDCRFLGLVHGGVCPQRANINAGLLNVPLPLKVLRQGFPLLATLLHKYEKDENRISS